jgi:chemotaxis receptor (MCP) glutamine deamidase CheD
MKHPHVSNRPARSLSVPHPGLPPEQRKRIYIGEIVASATPLVVQTLLGSCVAVCLRDPATGVGGMNHILLPGRCDGARCGVNAMELLINAIMQKGGDRRRLVAKVFGGANVLPALQSPTAGEQNAAFVRDFLATERIALVAQRLGGTHAVQVHFRTDTGEAIVHSVNGSRLPSILSTEDAYRCGAANITAGDTVLF